MKKFFKNRCVFSLIIVVVILGGITGFLNATKSNSIFLENIAEVVLTPIQKVFTRIGNGITDFFGYFSDIDELRKENQNLKDENAELQNTVREGESSRIENEELRRLLSLKEANPRAELECAEIIARSPSNWYNTITIDKGTVDGIAVNQPVISKGNSLIGRISDVGTTWAEVTTITDPEHGAGAQILRSGDLGVIEGEGSLEKEGLCKLSFVSKNSDIVVGDTVITSGMGGIYPKGLLIGKIMEIRPDIQGISQYAVIKPEIDIDDLKLVLVVKNTFELQNR